MTTLGARIKRERKAKKMTQEGLGLIIGVKKASISQWENAGVKNMEGDNLINLAKALGVNPNWLMTGKGTKDVSQTADPLHARIMQILASAAHEIEASGETFSPEEIRRIYRHCIDYGLDPSISDEQLDRYIVMLVTK